MADLYVGSNKVTGIKPPGSNTIIPLSGKKIRGINAVLSTTTLTSNQFSQSSDDGNRFPGVKTITLKEGTTQIPAGCFRNLSSLEYIIIPASVTKIYSDSFAGCTSLTDIYFEGEPPSEGIGSTAFSGLTLTIHYHDSDVWQSIISSNSSEYSGAAASIAWEAY